ncbi:MAG: fibronectin type III domain-containing protein [Methanosarcinaceae archaeon]|nr:fibronectin type III domain-containing protein [Methanosarcinaceae archaeon]
MAKTDRFITVMNKESILAITLVCLFVPFSQCTQIDNNRKVEVTPSSGAFMEIITTDSIVICWDPPSENIDSVDHYELYLKTSGQTNWLIFKQNIPANNSPCITVYRSEIPETDSLFYFAVCSVALNGLKSDFHSSSDSTASPPQWYVLWKNN